VGGHKWHTFSKYSRDVGEPVQPGPMEPVPPALRLRVREALASDPTDHVAVQRLERLLVDGERWLGADPVLADVGYWMIEPRHGEALRRVGCRWLRMFPSPESIKRLAAIALDAMAPPAVRDQAIATLGNRELRGLHPQTMWPLDAVQLADEALWKLADAAASAGTIASAPLTRALRHVQGDTLAAVFARAPGLWADALECFASAPLARVLFVANDDIPPHHRVRVLRLVAATIGEEAVPLLVSRAGMASLEERLEMLLLAVAIGGEAQLPHLEDALRGMKAVDPVRARARWHLANPGVVPTVRGLRIARVTATMPPGQRAARCAQAADDLGAFTAFARHSEPYLYELWAWMVRAAADPARARELVAAHPESERLVAELWLEDLARRGRTRQLALVAQAHGLADAGALQLAVWGRPLAALELAATARASTPELACARALACYRAGRVDLTERILADDLPFAEPVDDQLPAYPGPHERWLLAHAQETRPALATLAGGRDAIVALAKPASHDSDPDITSLAPIAALSRRLSRSLAGATVALIGTLPESVAAFIVEAGGRAVAGALPGTDYYIASADTPLALRAQLERQGTRRLAAPEGA
jgi:hypothetical protein